MTDHLIDKDENTPLAKPTKPEGMSVRKWLKINFNETIHFSSDTLPDKSSSKTTSKLARHATGLIPSRFIR